MEYTKKLKQQLVQRMIDGDPRPVEFSEDEVSALINEIGRLENGKKSLYRVRVKSTVNIDDTSTWLADQTVRATSFQDAAQTFLDADINWQGQDIQLFVKSFDTKKIEVFGPEDLE